MDVSILLCTWNNCARLSVTLQAIAACPVPSGVTREIVVVANNCTDGTAGVARELSSRLPLVYVEEPRQGLSRARNTGLRIARGHLIIFTDDDVTPSREWIAAYWEAYRARPRGACFGGRLVPDYEAGPPEAALLPIAGPTVTGLDGGPSPRPLAAHERFLGANWACPADALRRVGEFDVRLGLDASLGRRRIGEEYDLVERLRRAGIEPWYLPDAVVAHFVPRHKCQLPYMIAGWEAHGHVAALQSATNTPFLHSRAHLWAVCRSEGRRVLGVPWRAYRAAAWSGLAYLATRLQGRTGYREYAVWRFHVGALRGHRERWHDERAAARVPVVADPSQGGRTDA